MPRRAQRLKKHSKIRNDNLTVMRQPLQKKLFISAVFAATFWLLPTAPLLASSCFWAGTCFNDTNPLPGTFGPVTEAECLSRPGNYYSDNNCATPVSGSSAPAPSTTTAPPPTTETGGLPIEPITPRLQIPIPGLPRLSDVTVFTEDGRRVVDIPFLAEYLAGLYRFLVGLAGLVATVMIIVGGLRWLLAAGDAGKIGAAKETITSAAVGLTIALGSYIILFTLNPELVTFKSLRLTIVEADPLEVSLGTTTETTAEGGEEEIPGSYTRTITSCPFTLTATGAARRAEFIEKIRTSGAVTATSPREKVLQIAEIADICDAALGSCGNTAGSISALAGLPSDSCLNPPSDRCGTHGRTIKAISKEQRKQLYGLRCDFTTALKPGSYVKTTFPCVTTRAEATRVIRDYLKAEAAAGKLPGWPDEWADQMRPGDSVVVYNGNKDLVGAHVGIFLGWAPNGRMQVIQGGTDSGKTADGTWCVKSSCGDSMKPLLYIWAPD